MKLIFVLCCALFAIGMAGATRFPKRHIFERSWPSFGSDSYGSSESYDEDSNDDDYYFRYPHVPTHKKFTLSPNREDDYKWSR